MSSNDQSNILFLLLVLFFLGIPKLASAGIEFLSTPSSQRSNSGSLILEDTRFQFSSDRDPVSFHFSGSSIQRWQENPLEQSTAVLDYAYVGLPPVLDIDVSLGRIRTDEGEAFDGLYARKNITSSTGVSFFTGKATRSSNDLIGGRFSYRFGDRSKIGVSYISESAGPDMFREETALDLRLQPFSKVILSGKSRIDLLTNTWTEHSYSLKVGPLQKATLILDASLLDFGKDARESGPSAQSLTIGAGIRYPLSRHLAVRLDMGKTENTFAEPAYSQGITFSSSFLTWSAGISVVRREGTNIDIVEMNAHATKRSGALEAFLNLRKIIQDQFNSSNRNIASSSLGFRYDLSQSYKLVADFEGSRDSYSKLDLRSFIKLEYRFGA